MQINTTIKITIEPKTYEVRLSLENGHYWILQKETLDANPCLADVVDKSIMNLIAEATGAHKKLFESDESKK